MLSPPNFANIIHTHTQHQYHHHHQLLMKTMSIYGNEIMSLTKLPPLGLRKQFCFEVVKETVRHEKVGILIPHLCLRKSWITCIHYLSGKLLMGVVHK